jgi:hypothetical protein
MPYKPETAQAELISQGLKPGSMVSLMSRLKPGPISETTAAISSGIRVAAASRVGGPSYVVASQRVGYRATLDRTLFAAAALLAALSLTAVAPAQTLAELRAGFLNPPDAARPMVRWWWFGPAVEKPEILKELQQMKADGIGGAELAFVYAEQLDDPATGLKNLPFLSPEMLDDVNYAQAEGRKLGLRIDVTLCSGWPYGGPATPLSQATTRIVTREVAVPANVTSVAIPKLQAGESFISAALVNGTPNPPPVRGARGAAVAQRGGAPIPPKNTWDPASAQPITPSGDTVTVTAGSSPRVALFFVLSHTKQQVKRAAVGAEGWVLDPFSHDAVATHLKAVGEPLLKAFGATPPYAIFSDSLEAYGADWTPKLPEEFKKRRGYDLIPHLPELVAGGTLAADNIRHDYGVTLTELVNENYLTQINDWAKAHGTKFRSQTYGEPAVSFSSQNLAGLPEGEGPQWRAWSTLRWATSANHVFGNNVTSGETFTWLHSPVFRAVPLDMKVEADIDFIMGENQLIFHGWPYSPKQAFYPGWSLYAAANFNDNNPWHPVMPTVNKYITRMSYLMRQGQPANQVAILLPTDDVWASFSPTHTTVTGAMQPRIAPLMPAILSAGYNVDYIDAEAINKVGLGTHQILVLPATDRIPVETLQKIAAWVKAGGHVIAVGRAPSMDPEGKAAPEIAALSQQLFNFPSGTFLPDETHLGDALKIATAPDFQITDTAFAMKDQIGFVRRKLPNADVYLVINTANVPMDTTATFATAHKFAEEWDGDTATASLAVATAQPIHLAPYGSHVFVFTDTATKASPVPDPTRQLADLSSDWKVNFVSDNKTVSEATPTDWLADPATKNYSGEALYSRDFTLAAAPSTATFIEVLGGKPVAGAPNAPTDEPRALGPDGLPDPRITRPEPRNFAYYDAPIREAALVFINGKAAGALWHPPYRLDVSSLLKSGQNHIEIHVYNTALNAWSAIPPHDFGPLTAKYGDKFQMQDLDKVQPVSSGLLGPVHLVTEAK